LPSTALPHFIYAGFLDLVVETRELNTISWELRDGFAVEGISRHRTLVTGHLLVLALLAKVLVVIMLGLLAANGVGA
jgi:hypothetical protein